MQTSANPEPLQNSHPSAPGSHGATVGFTTKTLVLLTVALFLYQLLPIGLTDHDTLYNALSYWRGEFWDYLREIGPNQGRFYFYLSLPLQIVPFVGGSFVVYKIVTTATLALNFAVYFHCFRKIADDRATPWLALLIFVAALQASTNHSLLFGYFVNFQLTLSALCLAVTYLVLHTRTPNPRYRLIYVGSFAFALMNGEAFLMYVPLLLWIAAGSATYAGLRKGLRELRPITIIIAAYFIAYFGYRALFPSTYGGNLVTSESLNPIRYLGAVWKLSFATVPGFNFFDSNYWGLFEQYRHSKFDSRDLIWPLAHASIAFTVAFELLSGKTQFQLKGAKVALLGIALVLIPNLLISVTPLYQYVVLAGARTATHLSYFSQAGMAVLLLGIIVRATELRLGRTRLASIILAFLLATFAFFNGYSNHFVFKYQTAVQQKWDAFDAFLQTDEFLALPANSVLYAKDLWNSPSSVYYSIKDFSGTHNIKRRAPNYWEQYIQVKTGRNVKVTDWPPTRTPAYVLRFLQNERALEWTLIFAKLDVTSAGSETANDFAIFTPNPRALNVAYATVRATDAEKKDSRSLDFHQKMVSTLATSSGLAKVEIAEAHTVPESIVLSPMSNSGPWNVSSARWLPIGSPVKMDSLAIDGEFQKYTGFQVSGARSARVIELLVSAPSDGKYLLHVRGHHVGPLNPTALVFVNGVRKGRIHFDHVSDETLTIVKDLQLDLKSGENVLRIINDNDPAFNDYSHYRELMITPMQNSEKANP